MSASFDRTWMWHPAFSEEIKGTAGSFVHFRRDIHVQDVPTQLKVQITVDTRYKLYINSRLVCFGPVKGDQHLWFYDEVDIGPFLKQGHNKIRIHVLRFFHSTAFAPSFPRLPSGGLRVSVVANTEWAKAIESSELWNTAIDPFTVLRIDEPEDHFLHIYERKSWPEEVDLDWVAAKLLEFKNSTGNSPPWQLSPRLIPPIRMQNVSISRAVNVMSRLDSEQWSAFLLKTNCAGLLLPAYSKHRLDLEMPHHVTAFLRIRFKRPTAGGGRLTVTYSESYEEEPRETPWVRRKENRCDYSKNLYGPRDIYEFQGPGKTTPLGYDDDEATYETFMPFHFRTFRFLRLDLTIGSSDLVMDRLDIESANYPLDVNASFEAMGVESSPNESWNELWTTSIRTLFNCMHDCYEDCPFYEQLQYAMDTRSSSLFTYLLSGDDRLARQAIIQLHNSFQARLGLTASRAPSHRQQFIPHFSLYWVCLVVDHWAWFSDEEFSSQFLPVIDSVLRYFSSRIDSRGLFVSEDRPGIWNFVDWVSEWKPHGIPPAVARTGISTFSNQLYAYTLETASRLVEALGRPDVASGYRRRADDIISALKAHCFDGELFSDTVLSESTPKDYSQHCQVWGVLCRSVVSTDAEKLLRESLARARSGNLAQESVAMSFYTMRALSMAGGCLYDEMFYQIWEPWRQQLRQNVTTWVEDSVSQRSDCHAWGSVPIYEFLIEVAGIHPMNGWSSIQFRPRLCLFSNFKASLPVAATGGHLKGFIYVSWALRECGDTDVSLRLDFPDSSKVPVYVSLPGLNVVHRALNGEMRYLVEKPYSKAA